MKKLLLAVILILATNNTNAAPTCQSRDCSANTGDEEQIIPKQDECTYGRLDCWGSPNYMIYTCFSCEAGYELKYSSFTVDECSNSIEYGECVPDCTGCSSCTSDVDWSASSAGYQKKTTRTCNCNTCSSSTSYRCATGYYGITKNGLSGCNACPNSGTSAPGSPSVTNCYLATGRTGSDASGTFQYTSDCYYSN